MMNKEREIEKINACISELSYDKVALKKAYNYYHCKRDAEQYRHLEENYGLGTPTSVGFTPLIKKHIDVLVGEYLELDSDLQISCKDEKTVSDIMRDKQLKIHEAVFSRFKEKLVNSIIGVLVEGQQVTNDPFFEQELEKIRKDIAESYVSEYEIAAQNILNYIKNSRDIDLKNKMRELFTDMLIGGLAYYRVRHTSSKNNMKLIILNPVDTFVERNKNEFYLNKSPRACYRRWLTRDQILGEYKEELSRDALAKLKKDNSKSTEDSGTMYVKVPYGDHLVDEDGCKLQRTPGILAGLEVTPTRNFGSDSYSNTQENVFEVWECEWIEYDEEKDRLTRHEGIRIGGDIYIVRGEAENIIRSVSNPKDCSLTINGIFFSDKNGDPFSLIINTMELQNRYDLTLYYRDSLVANSGTIGDWLDVNTLPLFLGEELPERVQKYIAYKKQGVGLVDSSQEGAQLIGATHFNGYDDTIKAPMIQAFQLVIDSIEQQACTITGVFPEKLGGIQQRDAVSNVKVGLRQSTLLTKQYFSAMDLLYKEVNYDLLNLAKVVYKNGLVGTLINGNKLNEIFTALPEYYTMTDFDLHIQDSTETFQAKEGLKAVAVELVKSGQADPIMLINIMTSSNLTELKRYVDNAVRTQKKENDAVSQLQQQAQQLQQQAQDLQQQLKQAQNENQKLSKEIEKNNQYKLELEKRRVDIEEQKQKDTKDYNDKVVKTKERQVDIEYLQLYDDNPYNNKLKDA